MTSLLMEDFFLDEIGEMPLALQVKLLRLLQNKEFLRVGGTSRINADVRFIAATNQDLQQAVKDGKFRSDLFYRLNVINIHIPPVRERRDEIAPLALIFLENLMKSTINVNVSAPIPSKSCVNMTGRAISGKFRIS